MKRDMRDVVIELTVENIPARFIMPAKKQMNDIFSSLLKERHLSYSDIRVCATYRRLTIYIKDVPSKTDEIVEKVYGPKASMLKDEKGNFTRQSIGFAESCGVKPEDLIVERHEKRGDVICAIKKIKPCLSTKVLGDIFIEMLKKLEFPKNMIWEESRFRFARPIRNILALWGDKVIPIEFCGVKSSKTTYGPYFTHFKKITVKNAESYFATLEKNYVIVDDDKRRKIISEIIKGVEKTVKCNVVVDDDVFSENLYLCEYPRSIIVKFPNQFLKLPKNLIELVMKKQLKIFPCFNDKGELVPVFIGIRDGVSKGQSNVESGYLNVFKARCSDALFFYETDLKTDPKIWQDKLKSMIFQGGLGSLYDKTQRVKGLVSFIARKLKIDKDLSSACEYIYYDLASNVVGEFPELEGEMNYYYAEKYGISDEEMKRAISEIYLPSTMRSPLPSNIYSCVIATAHKIDTIIGDFLIDMIPSGGNDPHGLRREAFGIIRICFEKGMDISLPEIIAEGYQGYHEELRKRKDIKKLTYEILDFIYQRAVSYFEEKGFEVDVIQSVYNIFLNEGDLLRMHKRIDAIAKYKKRDDFKNLAFSYKRLKNITNNWNNADVKTELFETDDEKKLHLKCIELEEKISLFIEKCDFYSALDELLRLAEPLEDFFKNVLVMVDKKEIRENRLSLLKKISKLFDKISDIGSIKW